MNHTLRETIANLACENESRLLKRLIDQADLSEEARRRICHRAIGLIEDMRTNSNPGLIDKFLAEYSLSTQEGIALMCLAEALLRVPDVETLDALIEDKIISSNWRRHLRASSSSLVNVSTLALLLTGKVLADTDDNFTGSLRSVVKQLGKPFIRTAIGRAMRKMGYQFVLGQTIEEAIAQARLYEAGGCTHSYDMLGESAWTQADAESYNLAYLNAIDHLAKTCTATNLSENPGISIKLSALHPRYEYQQLDRVMDELVPRVRILALRAKIAGMGINIDAEEADRLDLSLNVIEAVLADPDLAGWDGFGVAVQSYGKRAGPILDWLYDLAKHLDRKITVRLIKGAYWDTEIKHAQELGMAGFPVFTHKPSSDVSYIANARKLLCMTDRIYPQFASHNAHSVSAILEMADDYSAFEFQRLHGMGENLHHQVMTKYGTRCRIYAPVGAHRDLLAYLVRRLLENGANSSFVNKISDERNNAQEIAADPFEQVKSYIDETGNSAIPCPGEIFGKDRKNSTGWNLADRLDVAAMDHARKPFHDKKWTAKPLLAVKSIPDIQHLTLRNVINPANRADVVGFVYEADKALVGKALSQARTWSHEKSQNRANALRRAADLFEENHGEFFALLAREAGKTQIDCVSELREAVDFLRYYANEAERLESVCPRGIFACISPWNFPLAIFTGQISAALAAGNGVIAKPAEFTTLTACYAVKLLHEAGISENVLQFLPGTGSEVGEALSHSPSISGVCFTGSTATAQRINTAMAQSMAADVPLIAETGGLNAMVVDSTALPEQVVRDIVASAFQSAGQRCSALRIVYLQCDVAESITKMLIGAMEELKIGDPWMLATDIGPLISKNARDTITAYIKKAMEEKRIIKAIECPTDGFFVGPTLIRVNSILDLEQEVFGPVLHLATFEAGQLDRVLSDINSTGYGLTFGLHTRIESRIRHVVDRVKAGNIYINRNQIGAIVGSQPFGGEGLSGTGPKAGGPQYVQHFAKGKIVKEPMPAPERLTMSARFEETQHAITLARKSFEQSVLYTHTLPGPSGESNRLSILSRGVILCLGPGQALSRQQEKIARMQGCTTVALSPCDGMGLGAMPEFDDLEYLQGFDGVFFQGNEADRQKIRQALARRKGAILPLICEPGSPVNFTIERHVCIDTTAVGGNASLLASQ